jgi:hypothetical protein
MTSFYRWLLVFLPLGLAGCASLGDAYAPTPLRNTSLARVYVYRPSAFAGSARSPDIVMDGEDRGELPNGGYLVVELPAGDHLASQRSLGSECCEVPFKVVAGSTYYLRMDLSRPNLRTYYVHPRYRHLWGSADKCPYGGTSFGTVEDASEVLMRMDGRAQARACLTSFIFVEESLAGQEIGETRQLKR